ncbi:hypothetical protein NQ176_g690 [Zarea fungicola]|uniref:Uncharacterized protein n=1 Tax=Zarea fungicola TaxID=93591 RepID=A0ACC1NYR9_9HYPO|nr:hypothetical protein NQ176_g690 [Lecanicillium fungicola]
MSLPRMQRGFLDGFLDRLASWVIGLEAETSTYDVSLNIEVPMRDGVHLAATLYCPHTEPNTAEPAPMLLVQSCYGRGVAMSILNARLYAARGYIVLFVSSRGTFGSGGQFLPAQSEQKDGQEGRGGRSASRITSPLDVPPRTNHAGKLRTPICMLRELLLERAIALIRDNSGIRGRIAIYIYSLGDWVG